MKITNLACVASLILASLSGAKAATTLTAWTFDNVAIGASASPLPSTGLGTAGALGMANAYNNTNSISNPDVQSLAGSSTGNPNSWRVRGSGSAPFGGNGWSTNAPIGTQGAQFSGSTFGYYKINASFDVYATADAEANLQVQYTTDGTTWYNAIITSVGTVGVIASNSDPSQGTVVGSYIELASGWNTNITVDLSGISGVDNNPSFTIRLVNASTSTNCVDTTGAVYNDTSGSWTFDNVVISGTTLDTIADWTFESEPNNGTIITNPVPEIGSGTATSIGFDNNYTYAGASTPGSTNGPDVVNTGASSSGTAGPNAWRVRGNPGNNGWNTAAPIGTQGAQFDVSTVGYSNIVCTFDLYFTSQGEAKMCVLYTTDAWATTNVASSLFYGAKPSYIQTNPAVGGSANTVTGTYFYQTLGQGFYNNLVVDFTGVPGVDNNANFSFKVVNAATGSDCVAFNGGSYNNSSGNWRYDNVSVSGTSGTPSPSLNYDPNASVDGPFTNTFTDDPVWRSKIAAVFVNGLALTNSAYTTNTAGMIIFTPAKSSLLQSSGIKNIVIIAAGYGTAKVTQPVAAGVATKLAVTTQATAPSASGGTLIANPVLAIVDQYGNGTTNPYANVLVTASAGGASGWTLGGDTVQPSANGILAFTNLTATVNGSTAVSGAAILYTITGYTNSANLNTTTNFSSATFTIGAPPVNFTQGNLAVVQLDSTANNTTFSVIEIKPSAAGQTNAVNIIPISATGTNALRLSSSGSCGKLSLSDDGTLVCFAAFADDSAATPDETLNLNRAAAGLNYTNQFILGLDFTSISPNGSQARSAVTLDNFNWIVDDKGGLYYGNTNNVVANPNLNAYNNVVVRSFGGVPYVETQKTANGQVIPVVYALGYDSDTGLYDVTKANNLTTDANAGDFYMISTNCGATYDILYVLDQNSAANGAIKKYSLESGNWIANGSFTNGTGGDSLFATTNGNGGVYLFFTTGVSSKNQIIRLTDASGWGAPMSVISSNVLYTAPGNTYVKGLTFVPQKFAYTNYLIPPPILTAQSYIATNGNGMFTITNTPDDPQWRTNITSVTVNGSSLPSAAYATNAAGKLVFDPSQSPLLQTPGVKNIVISATGYSTNSITQVIVGGPVQLVVSTQPKAPAADGGILTNQPVVTIVDQNGYAVTTATSNIVAQVGAGAWIIGGTITKAAVAGKATFSGLTAFGNTAVTGATISFTSSGMVGVASSSFNIPAPVQAKLIGSALNGGKLNFAFTNATGLSFSILATNDVSAPEATWPVIGTATESPAGSGKYQFNDPNPATNGVLFYILRQP